MLKLKVLIILIGIWLVVASSEGHAQLTPTVTATPTLTATITLTATATPTLTPSLTPTITATVTGTPFFTETPNILRPDTVLTNAPQVEVQTKKVVVSFDAFDGASLQRLNQSAASLPRRQPLSILYKVPIRRVTENNIRDVKRLATKRTTLTIRNLKPGNYTASYRALIIRGEKELSSTAQSPKAPFTVLPRLQTPSS